MYEYVYDNGNMTLRVQNTKVLNVIYPKKVLSSISWRSSKSDNSGQYSTDVWEEIKASKAGSVEASETWSDWAKKVVKSARDEANIGDYDLKAIYVVKIAEREIARDLKKIEQYQGKERDIVLLSREAD